MAKKKKFSMNERIHYYSTKYRTTKNSVKRAKYEGLLDAMSGNEFDGSKFKRKKEYNAYFAGVDKGNKAFCKMRELKF